MGKCTNVHWLLVLASPCHWGAHQLYEQGTEGDFCSTEAGTTARRAAGRQCLSSAHWGCSGHWGYFFHSFCVCTAQPWPPWDTSAEIGSVGEVSLRLRVQIMQSWDKGAACTSHSICWFQHTGSHILYSLALSMQHRDPWRVHKTQITSPDCHSGLGFPNSLWIQLLRGAADSWHTSPLKKDHEISLVCFKSSSGAWLWRPPKKKQLSPNCQ